MFDKHGGNLVYRDWIEAKAPKYAESKTKQEKMRITTEIVTELKLTFGSRFLRCASHSSGWEELSASAARDKTSHALRFCVAHRLEEQLLSPPKVKRPSKTSAAVAVAVATAATKKRRDKAVVVAHHIPYHHRRTISDDSNHFAPLSPLTAKTGGDRVTAGADDESSPRNVERRCPSGPIRSQPV